MEFKWLLTVAIVLSGLSMINVALLVNAQRRWLKWHKWAFGISTFVFAMAMIFTFIIKGGSL